MRNLVAKHDFNRASVHEDQKKSWVPEIEDGLDEYYDDDCEWETDDEFIERIRALSIAEYRRGVNDSGIMDWQKRCPLVRLSYQNNLTLNNLHGRTLCLN